MAVIPTKVGIQSARRWIPTFVGMTDYRIKSLRFIILFGSFARGDFHEHSDVDLLIVKDTTDPMLRRMDAVLDLCTGDIAVEAFVYTPAELDSMLRRGSDFLERALADGRVIYERSESESSPTLVAASEA